MPAAPWWRLRWCRTGIWPSILATPTRRWWCTRGLLSLLLWLALRRVPFRWDRHTPWYGYLGGVMGVVTVLGANTCVASLGVTVPVAMMLVGQTLAGLAIDQFGFFGAIRRPLRPAHGVSLLLIAAGVAVLLWA